MAGDVLALPHRQTTMATTAATTRTAATTTNLPQANDR